MSDVAVRWKPPYDNGTKIAMRMPSTLPSSVVASVEVYADPRAALTDWHDLAASAPATPYGLPGWLLPWVDTVGLPSGIAPLIAVGRDRDGRAMALLPLGLKRQGPVTVATFLGGRDSNFNMGLFRPGLVWTREAIHDLLRRISMASDQRIDSFVLCNQPHGWQGAPNPLLALVHQPSPSFAYKAALDGDPEAFFSARLSRHGRKKLRHKMNRLRSLGPVTVIEARTPADIRRILDVFMAQRQARNAAAGLRSADLAGLRRFLDRTVGDAGPVVFHALSCGDRIIATLAGVEGRDRFSGMLTSFDAEDDFARTSPGELLLSEVIRRCCEAGLSTFDLGIGEAQYKETYCPEVEPLFDSLFGVTLRGHAYARAEAARLQLKRAIKQSPRAWPQVQRLRRIRGRLVGVSDKVLS